MFCPDCKTEYVEGIQICADCEIPLVAELPSEDNPETPEWVDFEEVLTTFNAGDIAFVKSILDGEDIAYFFQGEGFNYVHPLVQPPKLMVRKDQADQVREILKDLELDYTVRGAVKEPTEE
jgi:thiol-disulfide isomerase/thioredoxin